MVGGTIADIWTSNEYVPCLIDNQYTLTLNFLLRRGLPMSIFAVMAVGGSGFGPVMAGWIEMNKNLGWRWIQWIELMFAFFPIR